MRSAVITIIFLFGLQLVLAQNSKYDSLKNLVASAKDDSTRLARLNQLVGEYIWSYPDSSLTYLQQSFVIARRMQSDLAISTAFQFYSIFDMMIGDYPQALYNAQECLKFAEKSKSFLHIALAHSLLSGFYEDAGDYDRDLSYNKLAKSIIEAHWKPSFRFESNVADISTDTALMYVIVINGLATSYEKLNKFDLAIKYTRIVSDAMLTLTGYKWAAAAYEFGNIYSKIGNYPVALQHYREGIALAINVDNKKDLMDNYNGIANTFKKLGNHDSSIIYANKVLEVSRTTRYSIAQLKALDHLADIYKSENKIDSVAKYLQLTIEAKDSLFSRQKILQIQNMTFNEQLRQQEQAQQQQELRNKIKLYSSLAALLVFLIIAFLLYRNNLHKQKAYALLKKQKQETDIQKAKTEQTLEELKSTQAQLIQSEKMASLGELTAGIAHEIQNPLNFVNNFSEVSVELADELKEEINKMNVGEKEKENIENIITDLVQNQEKINQHGKRADAIVKSMLQHSRISTGQKELTDINALADEYLRLSYHGLRAKDKTFNATLQTDFDKTAEKINIIPQDIGRVLLNLFNNAFYSVMKKKAAGQQYDPTVSVCTKKVDGKIEIHVKDNGSGIPKKVLEKIFQPFFTTKAAGEGTGLGLSLSYDIIKAHSGDIKVKTEEGGGAEFVIQLPIN